MAPKTADCGLPTVDSAAAAIPVAQRTQIRTRASVAVEPR